MRVGSLVADRLQALGRFDSASRPDRDHHRRLTVGLEEIDADRGILGLTKRMPDQGSHALAVETDVERLAVGCLQPAQMKSEAARPATAHLHGREVTVGRRRRPGDLGPDGLAFDLEVHVAAQDVDPIVSRLSAPPTWMSHEKEASSKASLCSRTPPRRRRTPARQTRAHRSRPFALSPGPRSRGTWRRWARLDPTKPETADSVRG